MRKRSNRLAATALILATATSCSPSAQAASGGGASADVLINAPPEIVWHAVHEQRFHDPDICSVRVLQQQGNRTILEEVFQSVPIFGSVTAVVEQQEQPYGRIDFALVRSDKFKSLHGSWSLTPLSEGRQTLLRLTSVLDVGIPFSKLFLQPIAQQRLHRRLHSVKQLAEQEQMNVTSSTESSLDQQVATSAKPIPSSP